MGFGGKTWRRFTLRTMFGIVAVLAPVFWYVGNQLNQAIPAPIAWDVQSGENVKWAADLGSQTYSNPALSGDYVFIGTNNGSGYDPEFDRKVDLGVMLCFEKETGRIRWQHSNQKLETGRVNDWPLQGVISTAFAEGDRLWYVSNRGEVFCLDAEGFYDGENDGPYKVESSEEKIKADVVWRYDMLGQLGVFPHNTSHSNVVVDEARVYVKTSNGVDESHRSLKAPEAPSFVVLDRFTGELIWHDNAPGTSILHGSWGSARLATIAGRRQILFPGGDGWLYSYKPEGDGSGGAVLFWKYDCNPKTSTFRQGGHGEGRNILLTAPTVLEDRIYVTMGQDPEHGGGQSRVICIAPKNRTGDLSPTLVRRGGRGETVVEPSHENEFRHCIVENGDIEIPNPESARVWEYTGVDSNNDGDISEGEQMSHSLSRVVVNADCAFVNDMYGHLHCLNLNDGSLNWKFDLLSSLWSTPLVVDGHVFVVDEDGMVTIFNADPDPVIAMPGGNPLAIVSGIESLFSSPVAENGVIYMANRRRLFALEDPAAGNRVQRVLRKK